MAVEHLDQGWLYTMAIPRYETRLRLVLHVADSFRRRIAEAGHEFARSLESRRESENPSQQGLPNHGTHDLHRRLRLHRHRLLGTTPEADRLKAVFDVLAAI